jgi:hypothetical protein
MNSLQHRFPLKNVAAILVGFLMLTLGQGNILKAQIQLTKGENLPTVAKEGDWFWSSTQHKLWQFKLGKWDPFPDYPCRVAEVCHNYLVLKTVDYGWGLYAADGKPLSRHLLHVECLEGIVKTNENEFDDFWDLKGNLLSRMSWGDCMPRRDTVNGQVGYYVHRYVQNINLRSARCSSIHVWGFLGIDGDWIVAPIYDAPFQFRNGFAEVQYYGQKRKVNAFGEVVE